MRCSEERRGEAMRVGDRTGGEMRRGEGDDKMEIEIG